MSDPKASYGDPVEEPTEVDDVVGRANEGLADAEAAGADANAETPDGHASGDAADADALVEPADTDQAATDAPTTAEPTAEPAAADAEPAADEADGWASAYAAASGGEEYVPPTAAAPVAEPAPAAATVDPAPAEATPAATSLADDQPTEVVGAETTAGTAAAGAAATAHQQGQPIFVQAPEAPMPRGNRAAAGAIGLLAALSFAVLYLLAWLTIGAIEGNVTTENIATATVEALATWSLWVPVAVFFIAFWLLGAIINRGRWGYWVIFGLLVGVASYGGHLLGQLFQAPFWTLTASEGAALVEGELLAPLAIASFVFGRELTIWFGSWVAARGKRVTELNYEAQREYERTLEAGPQIVRPQQG